MTQTERDENLMIVVAVEKERVPFEEAYRKFLDSKVYGMLQRTGTLMWAENAEFIVDEYYRDSGGASCGEYVCKVG